MTTNPLLFRNSDVIKAVSNSFETGSVDSHEECFVDSSETSQFDWEGLHIGLAAPDCAEGQDGEVTAPIYRERKAANKGGNSVTPQLGVREQLKSPSPDEVKWEDTLVGFTDNIVEMDPHLIMKVFRISVFHANLLTFGDINRSDLGLAHGQLDLAFTRHPYSLILHKMS